MKDPAFRGAHKSDYFIRPDIAVFQQLQEQARGLIAVVEGMLGPHRARGEVRLESTVERDGETTAGA